MDADQQYILGFERADFWQLAEMFTILIMSLVVISVVYRYIFPRAFRQLGTLISQTPTQNLSFRQLLLRLPLMVMLLGGLYWLSKTYQDEETAQLILFGGGIGIVLFPAIYILHHWVIPFWQGLPRKFTVPFTSQAPGYHSLRTLRLRDRLDIAASIILVVAGLVLMQRTAGWIAPQQLIFAGLPIIDHIHQINMSWLDSKQKVLDIAELIVTAILIVTMVFPVINVGMRLIPSFNIKLTFTDHFGLLVSCLLGIVLGYSPILF